VHVVVGMGVPVSGVRGRGVGQHGRISGLGVGPARNRSRVHRPGVEALDALGEIGMRSTPIADSDAEPAQGGETDEHPELWPCVWMHAPSVSWRLPG
jgi:hypothetical protein